METAQKIFLVVTIIGAVNWGLIGFFDFNLVEMILGEGTLFTKIIYMLVGVSGLFNIWILFNHRITSYNVCYTKLLRHNTPLLI